MLNACCATGMHATVLREVTCQIKQHICCKLSQEGLLVRNVDKALGALDSSFLVDGSLAPDYGSITKHLA